MGIWNKIKNYIIADLTVKQDSFTLENKNKESNNNADEKKKVKKSSSRSVSKALKQGELSSDFDQNIEWIKEIFTYPLNNGLVIRKIDLGHSSIKSVVIYMDGLVSWDSLNRTVLDPLMGLDLKDYAILNELFLVENILTEGQVVINEDIKKLCDNILSGWALILIDGLDKAITVRVQGWEKKSIENPKTEMVVRGSQEGFTEEIQTNISMIRKRIKTPELIVEKEKVGTISRTDIAIIYIKSIANDELVKEVRRRISIIDYDYIADSGMVEQLIEDHPNSLFPSILSTERADRFTAQIAEGYIGIIIDNSPFGLIVPAHFPLFLQTAEDVNLRWPYGSFLRIIRYLGYFTSLFLPAFYVAIANFHMEMIPTTLILAIAGTRETVPLPVAAETVLLECMFELIREAGVRIPGVIGPTIGIVGALILGQAAVLANLVSPIVVIVTATTALASYTLPSYNLQFATRILRFVYLLAASLFGLLGIVVVWLLVISNRIASNSFGVPALSPIIPKLPYNDSIIRGSLKKQKHRSLSVHPKKIWKISKDNRKHLF